MLRPSHVLGNTQQPDDSKIRGKKRKQVSHQAIEIEFPVTFHSCHQNCSSVPHWLQPNKAGSSDAIKGLLRTPWQGASYPWGSRGGRAFLLLGINVFPSFLCSYPGPESAYSPCGQPVTLETTACLICSFQVGVNSSPLHALSQSSYHSGYNCLFSWGICLLRGRIKSIL